MSYITINFNRDDLNGYSYSLPGSIIDITDDFNPFRMNINLPFKISNRNVINNILTFIYNTYDGENKLTVHIDDINGGEGRFYSDLSNIFDFLLLENLHYYDVVDLIHNVDTYTLDINVTGSGINISTTTRSPKNRQKRKPPTKYITKRQAKTSVRRRRNK